MPELDFPAVLVEHCNPADRVMNQQTMPVTEPVQQTLQPIRRRGNEVLASHRAVSKKGEVEERPVFPPQLANFDVEEEQANFARVLRGEIAG